jgi:hypothetical protein
VAGAEEEEVEGDTVVVIAGVVEETLTEDSHVATAIQGHHRRCFAPMQKKHKIADM